MEPMSFNPDQANSPNVNEQTSPAPAAPVTSAATPAVAPVAAPVTAEAATPAPVQTNPSVAPAATLPAMPAKSKKMLLLVGAVGLGVIAAAVYLLVV